MIYVEIREALTLATEPRAWMVTENGLSVGGNIGTDGSGDLLFASPEEAEAWIEARYFDGANSSALAFEYERLDGTLAES